MSVRAGYELDSAQMRPFPSHATRSVVRVFGTRVTCTEQMNQPRWPLGTGGVVEGSFIRRGPDRAMGRNTFLGDACPIHCKVYMNRAKVDVRRRCGHFPHYFGHLFLDTVAESSRLFQYIKSRYRYMQCGSTRAAAVTPTMAESHAAPHRALVEPTSISISFRRDFFVGATDLSAPLPPSTVSFHPQRFTLSDRVGLRPAHASLYLVSRRGKSMQSARTDTAYGTIDRPVPAYSISC